MASIKQQEYSSQILEKKKDYSIPKLQHKEAGIGWHEEDRAEAESWKLGKSVQMGTGLSTTAQPTLIRMGTVLQS